MKRREFFLSVAGVSVGALTGCVAHPDVILVLNEVSDSELADQASNDAEIIERDTDEGNATSEMFGNGTYTLDGEAGLTSIADLRSTREGG
ncbi:MAG: hypothetical protein U5J64_10405 [Halobacteriales archaeon]|nr:hypothetical protein [Halobacteriales archaeon]